MTLTAWAERLMRVSASAGNYNSVDRVYFWARKRVPDDEAAHLAQTWAELDKRWKA